MPSRKRRHQEEDAAPEDPSGAEVPSSAPQSPVRMTEASIRSPVPTSSAAAKADSPGFSAFASSLPSLYPDSARSAGEGDFSAPPPSSPFAGFATALPNLSCSPAVTPAGNSIFAAADPASASGSRSLMLSPSGWQPISKARRVIMSDDTISSLDAPSSPVAQTPRMQVICFGESSLTETTLYQSSANSSPMMVGTFGSFDISLTPGSASKASKPASSLSDLQTPKTSNKLPPRRKLDPQLTKTQAIASTSSSHNTRQANGVVCKSSKVIAAEQAALKQEEEEEDGSSRGRGMRSRVTKSSEEESRRHNGITPSKKDSGQGKNSTTKEGGQSKNAVQKDGDKGKSGSGSNGVAKVTSAAAATTTTTTASTGSTGSTAAPAAGGMLPPQPPRDASRLCKCKKSKCIRQYCICFRANVLCQGCDCVDCFNDGDHEDERKAAVEHIKTSDPLAFVDKFGSNEDEAGGVTQGPLVTSIGPDGVKKVYHVRGCKCKNSRCQKKYCECFEYAVDCSSKCVCKDCLNGKPPSADEGPGEKRRGVSSLRASTREASGVSGADYAQECTAAVSKKETSSPPETPQRAAALKSAALLTPLGQGTQTANNLSFTAGMSPTPFGANQDNASPGPSSLMQSPAPKFGNLLSLSPPLRCNAADAETLEAC